MTDRNTAVTHPCISKSPSGLESGLSVISLLFATVLITVSGLVLVKHLRSSNLNAISNQKVASLKLLKRSLADNIDCGRTLGVSGEPLTPPLCASNFLLKTFDGNDIGKSATELGYNTYGSDWSFQGYCQGNALRVRARSLKPNPLLNKYVTIEDIFKDEGGMCKSYFGQSICPPGQTELGTAGGHVTCIRNETIVDFRSSETHEAAAVQGTSQTKNISNVGYCALVNVEFTQTHTHTHGHSSADSIDSTNWTGGVDCQTFQTGKGTWQILASTRAVPDTTQDVLCQFMCWKFFKD